MLGPTASGKSDVAVEIAERYGGEIVSVDSMQVYRGMDIGTAKATLPMQDRVPHHLLDICDPADDMSVAEFQKAGHSALTDLANRGLTPVICGGSGLHFRSLVDPLDFPPNDPTIRAELESLEHQDAVRKLVDMDSAASTHVDLANPRRVVRALEVALVTGLMPSERAQSAEAAAVREYRPRIEFAAVGLDPGPEIRERVGQRFDAMLELGLLDEVRSLRNSLGRLASQAVGYKQMLPVVSGAATLDEGREAAISATRALAKRQRTFFRRDPRIQWVPWHPDPAMRVEAVLQHLDRQPA